MPKKKNNRKMVFISREAEYNFVRDLYNNKGMSYSQIGKIKNIGKSQLSYIIKDKTREKSKVRKATAKKSTSQELNQLKISTGCIDCGYNLNPEALDWDHKPELGKKRANVAKIRRSNGKLATALEIAKCELRCSNCHRVRTHGIDQGDNASKRRPPKFTTNLLNEYTANVQAKIKDTTHKIPGRVREYIFDYIALIKESKPCMDCKKKFPYYVMDLDHVRGVKRLNLSELYKRVTVTTLHLIQEEIAKCELVCSNCHRTRTATRRQAQLAS
jgi:hypothetical protein